LRAHSKRPAKPGAFCFLPATSASSRRRHATPFDNPAGKTDEGASIAHGQVHAEGRQQRAAQYDEDIESHEREQDRDVIVRA
jgi:hypothetical protein